MTMEANAILSCIVQKHLIPNGQHITQPLYLNLKYFTVYMFSFQRDFVDMTTFLNRVYTSGGMFYSYECD
jgi:hypothetical protein